MAHGRLGSAGDALPVVIIFTPNRPWIEDRDSLTSAMTAQLSDLQVRIQWEASRPDSDAPSPADLATRPRPIAAFWFAADQGRLFLYGYDANSGNAERRRLGASAQQAQIEEASIIVRDSVHARLQGAPLHLGENVPTIAKPASEPPPAPPHPHASIDIGYVGAQLAPSAWQNGVSIGGFLRLGKNADLGIRALGFLPSQLSPPGLNVRLQRLGLRLEAGARASFGAPMVRISGGMFGDRITRETDATTEDFIATPEATRLTFGPFVAAEVGIRLTSGLHAIGGVSLEVPLRTWSYVVVLDDEDAALVPLRVRPGAQIGVKFDL